MGFTDTLKGFLGVDVEDDDDYMDDYEMGYSMEQEYDYGDEAEETFESQSRGGLNFQAKQPAAGSNVVPMNRGGHGSSDHLVIVKPSSFAEASSIADHLNNKLIVVLNLELAQRDVARRLIDFLSGVAYANGGALQKVASCTFVITPYNVEVSGGDVEEQAGAAERNYEV